MSSKIAHLVSRHPLAPLQRQTRQFRSRHLTGSRRRLIEAMGNIRQGALILTLPDNAIRIFEGAEPGIRARLTLRDWRALDEILARGQIGFADAYIDGLLDSDDLVGLMTFFLTNEAAIKAYFNGRPWHSFWLMLRYALRAGTRGGSRRNVAAHYNVGNDFFELWLDKSMTYSCALFEDDPTRSIEEAQAAKYQRILTRLDTKPGQHILDIGCGWGGFAEVAARQGINVMAITLSQPQADYARQRIERAGLQDRARIEVKDYRDVKGQFDHIVSIGMFEHVGEAYWPRYFETIRCHLAPHGKAMIQTIFTSEAGFREEAGRSGFIETYIFPGGRLPAQSVFRKRAKAAGLACREMFAFGRDYKRTLENWLSRFEGNLDIIRAQGRDERFIRLWRLYFCACVAAFATGRISVMQAELCPAD